MSPRRNARALARGPARPARPPRRAATSGRARALGQHFLRDDGVARRIVELAHPTPRDLCVEIGPGEGALTRHLAAACGRLIALEVDARLAARLRERFTDASHVEIFERDAVHYDYGTLRAVRPDPGGRVVAVGNLPYSAGKPILMALVEAGPAISEMVLMLQREVAERVAAPPGGRSYGALSVLTQLACEVSLVLRVPPGAFLPPPQVDSAVLHLRVRPVPPVSIADLARFRRVVQAGFSQRRKNLANALAAGLGLSSDAARALTGAAGIDPARRAETLSLAEFAALSDRLG